MQPRTRIEELPILLKAMAGPDLLGYSAAHVRELITIFTGFRIPEQRREFFEFIAKDNGAGLRSKLGVGQRTYLAMITYLINH